MKSPVSPGTPARRIHARVRPAPRTPATPTDVDLFRRHLADLDVFTTDLREGRCRRTNHFDARLTETVAVLEPLFARWNMAILFALYMQGPSRFNDLKRRLGGVSSRVLTDKLHALAGQGFVQPVPEGYALTDRGMVLAKHLHPLVFFLHNPNAAGPARGRA